MTSAMKTLFSGKVLLPLLALGLLAFAVSQVISNVAVSPIKKPRRSPPRSPFEAAENIEVGTHSSGIVVEVFVSEGDSVQAGDPLFRLEDRPLIAERELKKSRLETARQELEELKAQPRPEKLPVAEEKVSEAEARVAERRDELKRLKPLFDTGTVTEDEITDARQELEAARATLKRAEAELKLLKAGAWERNIDIAAAEVDLAQAEVDRIQADIELLTVRARTDARVLSVNIEPGEFVTSPSEEPLVVLGNVEDLHVRVDIDEYDIPRFDPSAPAVGMVKGHPEQKFDLKFHRVDPYVIPKESLTGRNTERVDTRVLQVIYKIVPSASAEWKATSPLYVGQQINAFIKASTPVKDAAGSAADSDGPDAGADADTTAPAHAADSASDSWPDLRPQSKP